MPDLPPYVILYRSTAAQSMMAGELLAIVEHAEHANAERGLTGLLLHGRMAALPGVPGGFVQWIEGPEGEVRAVYNHIRSDARHVNVEVLAEGPDLVPERLFPAWTMRMERLADLPATLEGFLRDVDAARARWAEAA